MSVSIGELMRLQEIITRYEYLTRTHQEHVEKHQQERDLAQVWHEQVASHQSTIGRLQNILVGVTMTAH